MFDTWLSPDNVLFYIFDDDMQLKHMQDIVNIVNPNARYKIWCYTALGKVIATLELL